MARTESTNLKVHPKRETDQLKIMETFGWNLLTRQEIKERYLEPRYTSGDDLMLVSENYINLTFSRKLDLENVAELKELERQYHGLAYPKKPSRYPPVHFLFWLIAGLLTYGLLLIVWVAVYFLYSLPKYTAWEQQVGVVASEEGRILQLATQY